MSSDQTAARAGEARRATGIAVILLAYYVLTMGGHHYSIDGIITFQAARNWVVHHSLFFDPPFRWGNNRPATSKYGVGLSISYLPILLPLHRAAPELFERAENLSIPYDPGLLRNDLYLFGSVIHPIIGALTGLLVYFLGRELRLARRWATFAALVNGVASPFATYVRFDFAQPLIGLLLVGATWQALRARHAAPTRAGFGIGLALGYAVLTRFTSVTLAPWILGLYVVCARFNGTLLWLTWRRGLRWGAAMIGASVLATLLVNTVKFGSPLEFGQTYGFSLAQFPVAVFGLLLSPGRGLLVFFPLAWIFVLGWPLVFRRRPAFAILAAGLVVTDLGLYGAWGAWWGGESWGPRYFVPTIPLMTLCVALWMEQHSRSASRSRVWLGGGLTLVSLIISLNGILFNFLDFYGRYWARHGFGSVHSAVREQMLPAASPLFAGWRFSLSPYGYDLYWLHELAGGSRRAVVTVVFLSASLVGATILLCYPRRRNFKRSFSATPVGKPAGD